MDDSKPSTAASPSETINRVERIPCGEGAPQRDGPGRRRARRVEHHAAERAPRLLASGDGCRGLVEQLLAVVRAARAPAPGALDRGDHRGAALTRVEPSERALVDTGEVGERRGDRVDRGRVALETPKARNVLRGVVHRGPHELALEQGRPGARAEAGQPRLRERECELVPDQHADVGEAARRVRSPQLQPGHRGRHHDGHGREGVGALGGPDQAPERRLGRFTGPAHHDHGLHGTETL